MRQIIGTPKFIDLRVPQSHTGREQVWQPILGLQVLSWSASQNVLLVISWFYDNLLHWKNYVSRNYRNNILSCCQDLMQDSVVHYRKNSQVFLPWPWFWCEILSYITTNFNNYQVFCVTLNRYIYGNLSFSTMTLKNKQMSTGGTSPRKISGFVI